MLSPNNKQIQNFCSSQFIGLVIPGLAIWKLQQVLDRTQLTATVWKGKSSAVYMQVLQLPSVAKKGLGCA